MLFAILASKIKAVITSRSKHSPFLVEFRAWEVDPAQDKVGCRIFLLAHRLLVSKPWHPGELKGRSGLRIRSHQPPGALFMMGSTVVQLAAMFRVLAMLKVEVRLQHLKLHHQVLLQLGLPMGWHRISQLRLTQTLMMLPLLT